jgi:hypothetical protein
MGARIAVEVAEAFGGAGGGTIAEAFFAAAAATADPGVITIVFSNSSGSVSELCVSTKRSWCVLLDQLAVDVRAVGAVEIFEERVVENVDDQRVVAAHRRIVDADVVVRQPTDGVTLLVHVVFGHYLTIEA